MVLFVIHVTTAAEGFFFCFDRNFIRHAIKKNICQWLALCEVIEMNFTMDTYGVCQAIRRWSPKFAYGYKQNNYPRKRFAVYDVSF